MKHVEPK